MRTARSRISGENLLALFMVPFSQELEPPQNSGRLNAPRDDDAGSMSKEQRDYDEELYQLRHPVKNAFLHLKRWRGIATRYAKCSSSLLCRRPSSLHRFVGSNLVTTL